MAELTEASTSTAATAEAMACAHLKRNAVKRDEGERIRGTLYQLPALQREVIALARDEIVSQG